MAGEVHVGDVAVGVVPDLRGFNDKITSEVVPAANVIGRQMGTELTRGITDNLSIGKAITDASRGSLSVIAAAGDASGRAYGRAFRAGLQAELGSQTIKIRVDLDTTAARLELDRLKASASGIGGGGGVGRTILGSAASNSGGGNQGPLDSALGGGTRSGLAAFLGGNQLLGITQGFAAIPLPAQIGAIGTALAALPLIAQTAAGGIVAALGGGLAALGVGGALLGNTSGQAAQTAALNANNAAKLRATAAQDNLNKLESSGKATAAQLASAEATLATANNSVSTTSAALAATNATSAKSVAALQTSFNRLEPDAKTALTTIGASFVPVMTSIFNTTDAVLHQMTPAFSAAVKVISGPFQTIVTTVLKAFTDPAVTQSIQAIAKAFGGLLTAFTPDIPGIVDSLAQAITRIATAISKNPKAFADFLLFLAEFVIAIINALAYMTEFADYVEFHFMPAVQHFVNFWKDVWRDVSGAVALAWHDVLTVTDTVWSTIVNFLSGVFRGVSGAFTTLWHDVENVTRTGVNIALTPVRAALNAFSGWWKQNGAEVKQIWSSFLFGITTIAKTFAAPFIAIFIALWNVVSAVWRFGVNELTTIWQHFANGVSQIAGFIWNVITEAFRVGSNEVAVIWDHFWNGVVEIAKNISAVVVGVVQLAWNIIQGITRTFWAAIMTILKIGWDTLVGVFTVMLDVLTGNWSKAWNDIRNTAIQIWHNIVNFFSGAGTWLIQAGKDMVGGLLNGILQAMSGIASWVNDNIVQPVINAVKSFFGIKSPSTVMMPIGVNIVSGMLKGIISSAGDLGGFIGKVFGGWPQALGALVSKSLVDITKLPSKALSALGSLGGALGGFISKALGFGGSGGVAQWIPTVVQALGLLGLPGNLLGQVLTQIQSESGGNPNAINNTDINAQMGDPSRGLLQTIGSTFAAYHVAGTSNNIYDPLANIAAALNYARHVYGPTLMSGGMGLGSGHGYDTGGWLPPGVTLAHNLTGRPELIMTADQVSAAMQGAGGTAYHAHFDGLTGAAIEHHVQSAFQAMAIQQGSAQRQGRRS